MFASFASLSDRVSGILHIYDKTPRRILSYKQ